MKYIILILSCLLLSISTRAQTTYEDLLRAARDGDLKVVRNLVSSGMEPDTADAAGNSLLMIAAREGRKAVVRYLVDKKARVRLQNGAGETAIMLASLKGYLEVVKFLRVSGSDINPAGWTPLHYCAWGGHVDVCRYLIEQGAHVDARSPNGTSPLMMAVRGGHADIVDLLLAHAADPSIRNESRGSALAWAKRAGDTAIAERLRRAGAKE